MDVFEENLFGESLQVMNILRVSLYIHRIQRDISPFLPYECRTTKCTSIPRPQSETEEFVKSPYFPNISENTMEGKGVTNK